jgi:hypothetical protein
LHFDGLFVSWVNAELFGESSNALEFENLNFVETFWLKKVYLKGEILSSIW